MPSHAIARSKDRDYTGKIKSKDQVGFMLKPNNEDANFLFGGPDEDSVTLRCTNGYSDSLLISPDAMGNPRLNLLYFLPNIDQTAHPHPSGTIGCVLSGYGEYLNPLKTIPLHPIFLFRILADGIHRFKTTDSSRRFFTCHRDSVEPTNSIHAMINKTAANEIPASKLK